MRRSLRWIILAGLMLAALPAAARALNGGETRPAALQVDRALRRGDRGEAVLELQRLLQQGGYDPGPLDGIFGPLTEGAVKRAQTALSLETDGLAGRLTVAALVGQEAAPVAVAATEPAAQDHQVQGLVVYNAVPQVTAPEPVAAPAAAVPFSLTFNGAPDPDLLPLVLDTLERYEARATFFLTGQSAERNPDLVAQIVAAGHEVASNGYSGKDLTRLNDEDLTWDLRRSQDVIEAAAGQSPAFFRPPQGRYSQRLLRTAQENGLSPVLWTNVTVRDLPDVAPDQLAERLAAVLYPGAVLMLHQDRPNSVEALDSLLRKARRDGYQSVILSDIVDRFS